MQLKTSWQESAVELFERATLRLTDDARKLQENVSWLQRAPREFIKTEAQWLRPVNRTIAK